MMIIHKKYIRIWKYAVVIQYDLTVEPERP